MKKRLVVSLPMRTRCRSRYT